MNFEALSFAPALAAVFLFFWIAPAGLALFSFLHLKRAAAGGSVVHTRLVAHSALAGEIVDSLRLFLCVALGLFLLTGLPENAGDAALTAGLALALGCVLSSCFNCLALVLAPSPKKGLATTLSACCVLVNLALMAALLGLWSPLVPLGTGATLMHSGGEISVAGILAALTFAFDAVPGWQPQLWAFFVWLLVLAPAVGLAIAQLWIIFRRSRDDFGRDYYSFALKSCAAAGAASAVLSVIAAFFVIWLVGRAAPETMELLNPGTAWALAGLILPLLAAAAFARIRRSATPLRHKVAIFIAPILLLLALGCTCAALYSTAAPPNVETAIPAENPVAPAQADVQPTPDPADLPDEAPSTPQLP